MASKQNPNEETQSQTAARLYNVRASNYDNSHHPTFAKWMATEMLKPQPGEQILDLACGTGLSSFVAAEAVGPEGGVVGVDVAEGMLMEAEKKFMAGEEKDHCGENVQIIKHDIASLSTCPELKGREGTFDAIICASALVLLHDPWNTVKEWIKTWLKPGGRLVTDVIDCRSQKPGVALERTCMRLGVQPPQFRLWVKDQQDFRRFLEDLHLDVEKIVFKESTGEGTKHYELRDVDDVWKANISKEPARTLRESGLMEEARGIFNDEWAKMEDENGKIEDIDGVNVCVARKPKDWIFDHPKPVISGSCACGNVKWSSPVPPTSLNFCHCPTCRKISGGPFLGFIDFPFVALTITSTPPSSYKHAKLSKSAVRGLCSNCGSTISMRYWAEAACIGMAMGSIDEQSIQGGPQMLKKLPAKHIFVKDRVSWYELPEDGLERQDAMESAAVLMVYDC